MNQDKLVKPSYVTKVIKQYQFRFKKRFGQNFLVDRNILNKIVESAELKPDQFVVEIGTGLGTLTLALAERCAKVVSFEIDRDLVTIFRENHARDNVVLVDRDALEEDWKQVLQEAGWTGQPVSLVANLPYYLTTPLIMKALEGNVEFEQVVVMVQREVAERMMAEPATKEYGILSLAVQYYASPTVVIQAPSTVFMPAPAVDSTVIKLTPQKHPTQVQQDKLFEVIRAAFSQRRKTLRNCLSRLCGAWGISNEEFLKVLQELGLEPTVRGEVLSLSQYEALTSKLVQLSQD